MSTVWPPSRSELLRELASMLLDDEIDVTLAVALGGLHRRRVHSTSPCGPCRQLIRSALCTAFGAHRVGRVRCRDRRHGAPSRQRRCPTDIRTSCPLPRSPRGRGQRRERQRWCGADARRPLRTTGERRPCPRYVSASPRSGHSPYPTPIHSCCGRSIGSIECSSKCSAAISVRHRSRGRPSTSCIEVARRTRRPGRSFDANARRASSTSAR